LGSAPDPAGLAYITLPNLLAVFKGPTSKQRERKGREMRKGGEKGGENDLTHPPSQIPGYAAGRDSKAIKSTCSRPQQKREKK